jgi:protein regulator of cytokinesis 1
MQLKELASKLINLWNLMDSPPEERNLFDNVTCNISASIDEVTTPGALALGLIKQVLKDLLKFKGLGFKSYSN